jgi:ATP-dependent 26S proteasome regulatory subunit
VPGTGKTMLCNALAKWALEQDYQAIYVSSADQEGSKFWKIQHALYTASNAKKPSLIILEELDAYLHDEEKALILNVLDGAESFDNEKGTLLIATTNYPEAIDERVLKRPGRLDRIYVVPPVEDSDQAEDMLKLYLKDMWRDEHASLAPDLVGYPGSFVREVVVFALTQLVVDEVFELSEEDLRESYRTLRDQIEARNDLIIQNANGSSRTGFIKDS